MQKYFKKSCLLLIVSLLVGCAGIRGYGKATENHITELCVVHNPRVTVPLFEEDLVKQLNNRNIIAHVIAEDEETSTPYLLRYSARRSMGVVSKITLSLHQNNHVIANINWDAGRSPLPPKISTETFKSVKFWQLAEALAGLFGEIDIK